MPAPSKSTKASETTMPCNLSNTMEDESVSNMSDALSRISMLETQFSTIASSFTIAIQELQLQAQCQEEHQTKQELYQAHQNETMTSLLAFIKSQQRVLVSATVAGQKQAQVADSGKLSTPAYILRIGFQNIEDFK